VAQPDDKSPGTVVEQPPEQLTEVEASNVAGGIIGDAGIVAIHVQTNLANRMVSGLNEIGPVARPDPPTGPPTGPKLA
jgi:hypothetical protein